MYDNNFNSIVCALF